MKLNAAKVTIVILNWNGRENTLECLKSVNEISHALYNVVVVDNGSCDGSVESIKKLYPKITVLETKANLGYAGGNNVGIRHAIKQNSDYILVLNNDTVVDPHIISEFVKCAQDHPDAGIFGAKIYYYCDQSRIWFGRARWNKAISDFISIDDGKSDDSSEVNVVDETDFVCGCAMFIRTSLIRRIGLFENSFFLCWEETDFCERAKQNGSKCLFVPTAKVWHKIAVSFKGELSPEKIYFNTRNKLLWAKRNLSAKKRWPVYLSAVKELFPCSFEGNHFLLIKNVYWDILRLMRRRNNPAFKARMWGIRDFVLRRYGNRTLLNLTK